MSIPTVDNKLHLLLELSPLLPLWAPGAVDAADDEFLDVSQSFNLLGRDCQKLVEHLHQHNYGELRFPNR